jgi:hypothetical protein
MTYVATFSGMRKRTNALAKDILTSRRVVSDDALAMGEY